MKKIFSLLILTTVTLFFGCADEDSTTPPAADTSYNALLRDKSVNDFTEEEAVYMTAQNLYNISEISEDAKKNLMTFYEMMKNGSIIPNGQGLGDIKYPSIASTAFQSLFQNLLAAPAQMGDIKTKSILTYSSVNVSEEEFSALLLEITNSQADISFLSGFMYVINSFVTANQEYIKTVSDTYESLLLDSSSSASKTAGGGGPIGYKKYNVSANIAYLFSSLAMQMQVVFDYDLENQKDRTSFISNMVYYLNDSTKLKITYDKYLLYFNVEKVFDINENYIPYIQGMLVDINTSTEIPGGSPYPATYMVKNSGVSHKADEQAATNPYKAIVDAFPGRNVADDIIYKTLGEKLIGSPAGNEMYRSDSSDYSRLKPTNIVTNNMLVLYQKLRSYGLKAPYFTSEIGASSLSLVIAKHVSNYGILYYTANKGMDGLGNIGGVDVQNISALIDGFFLQDSSSGIVPACELIKEYNKTLDDSAIDRAGNKGYFLNTADGGLCDIYMDPDLMRKFDLDDYNTNAQ